MKIQPVIVISPLVWLLVMFWKPVVVMVAVFTVLVYAAVLIGGPIALESARRHDAALPTLYIPQTWRDSLTQAALTPLPTPRPYP